MSGDFVCVLILIDSSFTYLQFLKYLFVILCPPVNATAARIVKSDFARERKFHYFNIDTRLFKHSMAITS